MNPVSIDFQLQSLLIDETLVLLQLIQYNPLIKTMFKFQIQLICIEKIFFGGSTQVVWYRSITSTLRLSASCFLNLKVSS